MSAILSKKNGTSKRSGRSRRAPARIRTVRRGARLVAPHGGPSQLPASCAGAATHSVALPATSTWLYDKRATKACRHPAPPSKHTYIMPRPGTIDDESAVPDYTLPALLEDGTTADDWCVLHCSRTVCTWIRWAAPPPHTFTSFPPLAPPSFGPAPPLRVCGVECLRATDAHLLSPSLK